MSMRRAASAPVRPVEMGTWVYFFSWEFTYQVAKPPMASVTTISSRYPLLNPNIGYNTPSRGCGR